MFTKDIFNKNIKLYIGCIVYSILPFIRITDEEKNQLNVLKKAFQIKECKSFVSDRHILNELFSNYIDDNGLSNVLETSIDRVDVDNMERVLDNKNKSLKKEDRVDTNFTPFVRSQLKTFSDALQQLGITKQKLTYSEIILNLLAVYCEKFPQMNDYLSLDQFIQQKIIVDKIIKKQKGIK